MGRAGHSVPFCTESTPWVRIGITGWRALVVSMPPSGSCGAVRVRRAGWCGGMVAACRGTWTRVAEGWPTVPGHPGALYSASGTARAPPHQSRGCRESRRYSSRRQNTRARANTGSSCSGRATRRFGLRWVSTVIPCAGLCAVPMIVTLFTVAWIIVAWHLYTLKR